MDPTAQREQQYMHYPTRIHTSFYTILYMLETLHIHATVNTKHS